MNSSSETVTMRGRTLSLAGQLPKVGDAAPDFEIITRDMKPFKLSDLRGKTVILSAVPSLDTAVCDTETRRFNQEAANLSDNIEIVTISVDLPFAQKRWCGAAGVDRITVCSDHKNTDFGQKYGVLIPELRLLARAVFVVDADGKVRYVELVPEIGQEPNYEAALAAAGESAN